MLLKLVIKNIALIDSAEINFANGLNVLSGETGSGKSVIIESLNFVLGAKADKSLVRSGELECFVKAEFDVSNNEYISQIYSEFDFDQEDILIISRKFNVEGKSSVKINGNTATISMLKKFTSALVDVHGQSEHFSLLKTSKQLELLDKLSGEKIFDLKKTLSNKYIEYKNILNEIEKLGGDEYSRTIRLDILNFQINEIESAEIKPDEESNLLEIKRQLSNQSKIISSLSSVKNGISDEGGIEDVLSNVSRAIAQITDLSEKYSTIYNRLDAVFSELSDISDCAGSMLEEIEVPEYDPDYIESRLETIKSLKNKYGGDVEQIYNYLENAIIERDKLENFNETANRLIKEKVNYEKNLYQLYCDLSDYRQLAAKTLQENIMTELNELGMTKAKFEVLFSAPNSFESCKFDSANGIDQIEFLFSANSGEPLKPLSSVISGGEMSRFMLAIKAQTAKYKDVSTFIFDEIDSGISGNVAKIVAEKFAKIAKNVQIIAITHLPQISAMADNNLLIEKTEIDNKTLTNVKTLANNDKVMEIVRLVGGESTSITAINHAEDLIKSAQNFKNNIN